MHSALTMSKLSDTLFALSDVPLVLDKVQIPLLPRYSHTSLVHGIPFQAVSFWKRDFLPTTGLSATVLHLKPYSLPTGSAHFHGGCRYRVEITAHPLAETILETSIVNFDSSR